MSRRSSIAQLIQQSSVAQSHDQANYQSKSRNNETLLLLCLPAVLGSLLVDFDAGAGDDPKVLGTLNLEGARGEKQSSNSDDLYIKLDKDPFGTPAAHFHRKKGDIRAEYHALNKKTEADSTYWIGYDVMLGEVQKSLMIWQFKEFEANSKGGANIPLAMEIVDGELQFQYQASCDTGRKAQWTATVSPNERYNIGIAINTATPGWVQLYWNGTQQTWDNGEKRLSATTFPGRADPKFGAYRGEEVDIDTWVYRVQIGTEQEDVREAAQFD